MPDASAAAWATAPIDPETAQWNERLEALLAAGPSVHTLPPQIIRDARERGEGVFGPVVTVPEAENRTVAMPGRVPVVVRIQRPARPRGVYLHIHGGGWMLGRAHHSDVQNRATAAAAGVVVVSVDYRLAPEHPYPAGPDDCETVALWLVAHGARELGADRLLIGGESAGAHLALVTLLRMREHGVRSFRGANLVYGCYDLGMVPSVRNWGERNLVLSTPIVRWFVDSFVPAELRAAPDVSPLHADLRGLPPALLSVGTLDPLLDDSLFLNGRYLAAGNGCSLEVYPGGIHAFNLFPIALAERANARMHRFLAGCLEG